MLSRAKMATRSENVYIAETVTDRIKFSTANLGFSSKNIAECCDNDGKRKRQYGTKKLIAISSYRSLLQSPKDTFFECAVVEDLQLRHVSQGSDRTT